MTIRAPTRGRIPARPDRLPDSAAPRYALYLDAAESELGVLGSRWLGRDAASGARLDPPVPVGFAPERFAALTGEPRRYGFHATLKAPMRLARGFDRASLCEAVAVFAASRRGFALPPLELGRLGSFLALRLAARCAALESFAADCVMAFDALRAPPDAAEAARRRRAVLTPRQMQMLERWGYPYVLDEYRFHFTLTGTLAGLDASELLQLEHAARRHFRPAALQSPPVRTLAVYEEPAPGEPFRRVAAFALGEP